MQGAQDFKASDVALAPLRLDTPGDTSFSSTLAQLACPA